MDTPIKMSKCTKNDSNFKEPKCVLKWYYNLEFFFVICVIIDLFVQCFRRADMSDRRAHLLYRFEASFTGVFMVEIILRFAFYFPNWRLFFRVKETVLICFSSDHNHHYYRTNQSCSWTCILLVNCFQVMRAYRVVLWTSITRNLWLKSWEISKQF